MVTEMLRESPAMLHLRAEINPFLRLAGLAFPYDGRDSDVLTANDVIGLAPAARQMLDQELALDAGCPASVVDDVQYALDVAWRFTVQWPELDFAVPAFVALVRRVLEKLRSELGWAGHEVRDVARCQCELLHALRENGFRVSPRYYDLPARLLDTAGSGELVRGAPGRLLIEEPPFVLTRPWRRADEHDVASKPLLIKTPSNAYRIGFLRALFPNARLRIVHLTRNPAGAINGLYDGWRHHGFHAHRMSRPLRIAGYAEDCPADRWWWKFDLPPGWAEYVAAPLPQVCGFQWRSCHQAILAETERDGVASYRLRFEDLTRGDATRIEQFERLTDWLGIPFTGALRTAAHEGIAPVAATAAPNPRRWLARADAIRSAITDEVRGITERLGYGDENEWI